MALKNTENGLISFISPTLLYKLTNLFLYYGWFALRHY